jgi:hypothetical protein
MHFSVFVITGNIAGNIFWKSFQRMPEISLQMVENHIIENGFLVASKWKSRLGPNQAKTVDIPTSGFVPRQESPCCNFNEVGRRVLLCKKSICLTMSLVIICEWAVVNVTKLEGRMLD